MASNERALVIAGLPSPRKVLAEALGSLYGRFAVVFADSSLQEALKTAPLCSVVLMDYMAAEGAIGTKEIKQLRNVMRAGAKLLICVDPNLTRHDKGIFKIAGADAVLSRREIGQKELLRILGDS